MTDINDLQQKELEELTQEEQLADLETLILEGTNAKIPFTFIYPNTTKKVGVMLRPLTGNEYTQAIGRSRKFHTNFLTEILKMGLYTYKGDEFPEDKIELLPAGVVTLLSNEISRISGVDLAENVNVNQNNLFEDLMGF